MFWNKKSNTNAVGSMAEWFDSHIGEDIIINNSKGMLVASGADYITFQVNGVSYNIPHSSIQLFKVHQT